jgi:hypothetical protein
LNFNEEYSIDSMAFRKCHNQKMKPIFLLFIFQLILVNTGTVHKDQYDLSVLQTFIENIWSIDILRIIFEFLNHDDFMEAIKLYNLTSQRLNGLKVTAVHERSYGTQIVEYYGGWEYDVNGIHFCSIKNMKQMAIIRFRYVYEPPVYVYLYTNGKLKIKFGNNVEEIDPYPNVESFFIMFSNQGRVNLHVFGVQENDSINIYTHQIKSFKAELLSGFHDPFSNIYSDYLEESRVIIFNFHVFDANKIANGTYICIMSSTLFTIEQNPTQMSSIYYFGQPINITTIRHFYDSETCGPHFKEFL